MMPPDHPTPDNVPWFIPAITVKLLDGSTLVKPGKAIQRATTTTTAKMTGIHRHVLNALADCGLIRRAQPSPGHCYFYPGEVEALIKRTEADPNFWNEVRRQAYLKGSSLKTSRSAG
jgi:hypothetical protein